MAGCFENLKAIFGENVSDSEIAAALKDIEEMKKAYGSDFMRKFNENTVAMEEISRNKIRQAAYQQKVNISNRQKFSNYGDMQNALSGFSEVREGGNYSVDSIRQAAKKQYAGPMENFMDSLTPAEVELLNSRESTIKIYETLFDLQTGKAKEFTPSDILGKVAKIAREAYDNVRGGYEASGKFLGNITNYDGWRKWDKGILIAKGKDNFIQFMRERVNISKTMPEAITPDQVTKRFSEIYDHIVMGETTDFTKNRSIFFKDGKGTAEAIMEFTKYDNFLSSFIDQMEYSSKQVALMQVFGPNHIDGVAHLKKNIDKKLNTNPDGKIGTKDAIQKNMFESAYKSATGLDNGYETALSDIRANITAAWQITKMGGSAITAMAGDANNMAQIAKIVSAPETTAPILNIYKLWATLGEQDRKEAADIIGLLLDSHTGQLASQVDVNNPGALTQFAAKFHSLTGLKQHTERVQTAVGLTISKIMHSQSSKAFSELPDMFKTNVLTRYGIDEKSWNIIRNATGNFGEHEIIVASKILEQPIGGSVKAKDLQTAYLRFTSMINDYARATTLDANSFSKAWSTFGTEKGGVIGEVIRLVTQFRSASIQQGRLVSRIAGSFEDGSPAKYKAITSMMGASAVLGALSIFSKQVLIKGEIPSVPQSSKEWAEFVPRAFVAGGGGGILTDFAMAEYDKSYRSITTDLLGPTGSFLEQVVPLAADIIRPWEHNYGKNVAQGTGKLIYANTPNYPIVRPVLNALFLDSIKAMGHNSNSMNRSMERNNTTKILPSLTGAYNKSAVGNLLNTRGE